MITTELEIGRVSFDSSCQRLKEGFEWAKSQALAYISEDTPVGKYYEASLPGRDAFCMRDIFHQSVGANILGLQSYTKNMLYKFAENIAESRDWCSYWEIDKYGRPAAVDYIDDSDFWYNLPANFDMLDCCYKQFLWTGDLVYIYDPVFQHFYDRSVTDYIERWDKDKDGFPEHYASYGRRGIASYMEDGLHPLVAGDLVATQYAAFRAYSNMHSLRGNVERSKAYAKKAGEIRATYNHTWWNEESGRFNGAIMQDRSFYTGYYYPASFLPLYHDLVEHGSKRNMALLDVISHNGQNVEEKSSLAEIFYKYGMNHLAYTSLLEMTDPLLKRREYPEVSYSVVGALFTGMMGISSDAAANIMKTVPRLSNSIEWVDAKYIPVLGREIHLAHVGNNETTLTNMSKDALQWEAQFVGDYQYLLVNGLKVSPHKTIDSNRVIVSSVMIDVMPSESMTVRTSK